MKWVRTTCACCHVHVHVHVLPWCRHAGARCSRCHPVRVLTCPQPRAASQAKPRPAGSPSSTPHSSGSRPLSTRPSPPGLQPWERGAATTGARGCNRRGAGPATTGARHGSAARERGMGARACRRAPLRVAAPTAQAAGRAPRQRRVRVGVRARVRVGVRVRVRVRARAQVWVRVRVERACTLAAETRNCPPA